MKAPSIVFGLLLLTSALAPIIGADVAGVWTGRIIFRTPERGERARDLILTLKTTDSSVTGTLIGTWDGHRENQELLDGKMNGNAISFSVPSGASDMPRIEFVGKQDGDDLTLIISGKNQSNGPEWKFGDGRLKRTK